jgi:hypothetical protein
MPTRDLDAAYSALESCRQRVPILKSCFRGQAERTAIDEVLGAIERLEKAVAHRKPSPTR